MSINGGHLPVFQVQGIATDSAGGIIVTARWIDLRDRPVAESLERRDPSETIKV
jgi:hypothetical protein